MALGTFATAEALLLGFADVAIFHQSAILPRGRFHVSVSGGAACFRGIVHGDGQALIEHHYLRELTPEVPRGGVAFESFAEFHAAIEINGNDHLMAIRKINRRCERVSREHQRSVGARSPRADALLRR